MSYKYRCDKCGDEMLDIYLIDYFSPRSCECGGRFIRVVECDICGQEYMRTDTVGYSSNVCYDCIDDYKHDIDVCYKVGQLDTKEIKINAFLAEMFEKEDIEQILFDTLAEAHSKHRVNFMPFINSERDWFADCLEEVIKNENCEK